jgi:hypothetical protein
VAITAPVPRPTHHLSGDGPTTEWHSRATLSLVRSSPVHSGISPEHRRSFRSPHPSMVSSTAVHFELGPRSLGPAAVFAARLPSLFETRRRLTTSATAYDVRATKPYDSRCPRRDDGLDHLPFLTQHAFSLARAVLSGEPRDVRLENPGAGSSHLRRVAQPRCLQERPATPGFTRRCIARINVHGSKDRVKDASRGACDDVSCLRPVPTLEVA